MIEVSLTRSTDLDSNASNRWSMGQEHYPSYRVYVLVDAAWVEAGPRAPLVGQAVVVRNVGAEGGIRVGRVLRRQLRTDTLRLCGPTGLNDMDVMGIAVECYPIDDVRHDVAERRLWECLEGA